MCFQKACLPLNNLAESFLSKKHWQVFCPRSDQFSFFGYINFYEFICTTEAYDLIFMLSQPSAKVNTLCKCTVRTFLRRSEWCWLSRCTAATGSGLACSRLDNQRSESCLLASRSILTEESGMKSRRMTAGM